ncbi:MAG: 2-oxo acid dehydrogenase subunit E2 [Firmicutes bacterium]|nr:2-oxo acid dehydrogenase subunit E2 [Bacillota bacterium]
MATKVVLPMLGQTMEEGTIIRWIKQEGETVEKGEPLLEVMTDKVNMEVEAPATGVLRKIIAQPEEVVPVMGLIGIIGTPDEPIDDILAEIGRPPDFGIQSTPGASTPQEKPTAKDVQIANERVFISPRAKRIAEEQGVPIEALAGRGTGPNGRVVEKDVLAYIAEQGEPVKVKVTPLAAKIAAEQGISLKEVVGTGPQGKITREDVIRATSQVQPSYSSIKEKVIPFSGIRKIVADNVTKSAQSAPHVTLTAEVDMTEAVRVREQILAEFERKYGVRLSFTDLIVKAAARAILDHPMVNASLQGNEIRIPADVNIGIAVAIEGGLVVPVIHNAEKKSLAEISTEIKRLVDKARSGGLSGEDMAGGTFTITNLGAYGVDIFNPIITPGQSAILGVCRIAKKPVAVADSVAVRSMMNLCLSFDHRVLDGAPAAEFLQKVKELLESPYQLLI